MSFIIQSSNPSVQALSRRQRHVETLCQGIQRVFPLNTEEAIIVWNNLYIPIDYKYELSVIINDLLPFLSCLLTSKNGSYKLGFGVDTIRAIWDIDWDQDQIRINSEWDIAPGNLKELLNKHNSIELNRDAFLAEWKKLLETIITSINKANILIKNQYEWEQILEIYSKISNYGYYYSVFTYQPDIDLTERLKTLSNSWFPRESTSPEALQNLAEIYHLCLPNDYQQIMQQFGGGRLEGKNSVIDLETIETLADRSYHEDFRKYVPNLFVIGHDTEEGIYFYDPSDWIGYGAYSVFFWPLPEDGIADIVFVGQNLTEVMTKIINDIDFLYMPNLESDMFLSSF